MRDRVTLNEHTAKNWRNVLDNMTEFAARAAYVACCGDGCRRWLYYAEADADRFGDLLTLADHEPAPDGYHLAHNEPVMTAALTVSQCRARIAQVSGNLPLIANGTPARANPVPVSHRSLWYNEAPDDGITHD